MKYSNPDKSKQLPLESILSEMQSIRKSELKTEEDIPDSKKNRYLVLASELSEILDSIEDKGFVEKKDIIIKSINIKYSYIISVQKNFQEC